MKWKHIKECCGHLYRKTTEVEKLPWGFSYHKWEDVRTKGKHLVISGKTLTYIYFRAGKYAWATWYWRGF